MSIPIIAIVGRPNVGKSTLFNKLAGKRIAIVEDTPGVTRDRLYYETEWNGRRLLFVDTGGIEPKTDSFMLESMRNQANIAIETSDVIVFLTDVTVGLTDDDRSIASSLIKSGKPVILAVNKCDSVGALPFEFYEFYNLGFRDDPIAVSAIHGNGTGDLLDKVVELCPKNDSEKNAENSERIKIAVIGKPNAGKSSLVNRMLGDERMIVTDVAGTTRDAIDSSLDNKYGNYVIIDTAGIRRQSKIEDPIEKYSVLRAKLAVDRSDVCLVMIDAEKGFTEQDVKIAGIAHEAGKPSVICVNKWDLIEKDTDTSKKFSEKLRISFSFMPYASVAFISAKTGRGVDKLFDTVNRIYIETNKRISTGLLNDVLNDATTRVQPPSDKGKFLKIYYMTQVSVAPPTFVIFCNDSTLFHFSYQRYIENRLRGVFGFEGTPVKLIIRERGNGDK